MLSERELARRLHHFIISRLAPQATAAGVTDDTLLFEERVLDSLRILEVIAFLESELGRRIPDAHVVLANFRSIGTMARVFSAGGDAAIARPRRKSAIPVFHRSSGPRQYHSSATAVLLGRGEIEVVARGEIKLHHSALALTGYFDDTVRGWAAEHGAVEHEFPEAIEMETLRRAGFLAAFPQKVVKGADADSAMSPAVCYHAYPRYAGGAVAEAGSFVTAACRCFREEQEEDDPLERLRAFTMRELIVVGSDAAVERLRDDMIGRVSDWMTALGLDGFIETATDPFFTTEARGRRLMQEARPLKFELRLSVGANRTVAAASFNNHQQHFGRAFDIHTLNGEVASSGCVAFGWERWVLGFIAQHGPDEASWPDIVRGHAAVS
ncbi:MAG TPA: aminoacyl--tRNA ligase-related protein [Gemmatimonadaceae bacterium]|nr:aminoacyl--tRNA ligase-related protein [Gemmatimonadaceae bacterium]